MDSAKKSIPETGYRDTDADLSLLLYKSGRALKNFMLWIGRGISRIGSILLVTLLFLMRNILWLLLGAVAGLSYGMYLLSQNGSGYSSEMTVRANFNSARELYNTMDYMNSLIAARQLNDLSQVFEITPSEARQLSKFTAEPVKSELIIAQMYKEEFFRSDHSKRMRLDTFWTRTIKYEDFKESLTTFDYPYHGITVISTNPTLFPKLQKGIIKHINTNELLQEVKQKQLLSNTDEEELLSSSIKKLDTLRKVYNERLLKGESSTIPGGNQMTVMEGQQDVKVPELDLYDKMLELQDDLKKSRNRSAVEKNIIEVYSPFNPVGKKISFFQSIAMFVLYGFGTALCILLLIALYRWLVAFEATHHPKKLAAADSSSI